MIDAHLHLADKHFPIPREEILSRARSRNITTFLSASIDTESWCINKEIKQKQQGVMISFGIHPFFSDSDVSKIYTPKVIDEIRRHACALGEIGLDKHISVAMDQQETTFRFQLSLAEKLKLPVIIHARSAWDIFLSIISEYRVKGMIHNFTGSIEIAEKLIAKGFYLSISGIITRKNTDRIKQMVRTLPLESFLIETDAPDMLPDGRDAPNVPEYLIDTAAAIASIRNVSIEKLDRVTSENFRRLFS